MPGTAVRRSTRCSPSRISARASAFGGVGHRPQLPHAVDGAVTGGAPVPEYVSDWGFSEWASHVTDWSRDLFDGGPASERIVAVPREGSLRTVSFDGMSESDAQAVRTVIERSAPDMLWLRIAGLDRHTPLIGLQPLTGPHLPFNTTTRRRRSRMPSIDHSLISARAGLHRRHPRSLPAFARTLQHARVQTSKRRDAKVYGAKSQLRNQFERIW